ncbi:aspartate racemase [Candidatus Woesearchaeota archaeon CG10_big_fil_rev_8_21_14_0_10_37_12]|nr:MAG: aspartate racemase [Candidatus Woesearchaeota archaeon CG10_big_fil_rev_8_21_14_0_10_37_12]
MKTIGLIGGMSWHSTIDYYKIINELISKKLGGWHSAKIILYSVDFEEIDLEHMTDHAEKSDQILFTAAQSLEKAGADFILIGANTAHVLADQIQKQVTIPILHIADATAEHIKTKNITKVGLLGTAYTMQQDFYKKRLENKGLTVLVPELKDQETINNEINNVCMGKANPEAKQLLINIINTLEQQGVEGIILGCTELPLIVNQKDVEIPLFNTTRIHAEAAVKKALE